MKKIISISNQKGGVGKTTTAVNLAASLAAVGRKTLLIDMDPQGNATSAAGVTKNEADTLYAAYFEGKNIKEIIRDSRDGYSIVPGGQELIALDIDIRDSHKQGFLTSQLAEVQSTFDYTIIDTPPTLNQLTTEALLSSVGTLIPLQCEYYSLEGLTDLINTINALSSKTNTNNRVIGIIRTMVDMRNNLAKEVSQELEKHFKNALFNTLIPRNVKLAEAPSFGISALQHKADSFGAMAYLALAGELIRRVESNE